MADPISISSGIAGLISLASLVLGQCYRYGCAVADAPGEARRLATELTALSGILVGIRGLSSCFDSHLTEDDLPAILKGCEQALQQISTILETVSVKASTASLKRTFNRLAWPLRKSETLELVAAVERQKGTLSLAIETLTAQLTIGQEPVLKNVQSILEEARAEAKTSQLNERRKEILRWLSDHDFEAKHKRASAMRNSKTCRWLLKTPQFRDLMRSQSACLWLHGIAGSGKTILVSSVIDHILSTPAIDGYTLAYFYCDAGDSESQKPEVVLGTLLCQMCSQLPEIPNGIDAAFANATSTSGQQTKATAEELQDMMVMALRDCRNVVIVVDGLDEAIRREQLCELLASLPPQQDSTVQLFVTSRPEPDIRRFFGGMSNISAQCKAADSDIDEYIAGRIASNARLRKMSDGLRRHVHSSLRQGAQGMFRWVQCQMDEIARMRTEKAVKDCLRTLPGTLHDTYARILSQIPASDVTMARRALFWLTWAIIPLSPRQLAEAAIFHTGDHGIEADMRLTEPLDILEVCGSLTMYDERIDEVGLAHHSVRDYLSEHLFDQFSLPLQVPDRQAHYEIAKACLAYLLLREFSSGWCRPDELESRRDRYPLLSYAAEYWPSHVKKSKLEEELQPFILRLMKTSQTPHFLCWLQIVLSGSYQHTLILASGIRWNLQPLYYAASYGLTATVQSLIKASADINEKAGLYGGTALHAACFRDHPDVVTVLLEAGADGTIRDDHGDAAADFCMWNDDWELLNVFEAKGQTARRTSFALPPGDKSPAAQPLHSSFNIEIT